MKDLLEHYLLPAPNETGGAACSAADDGEAGFYLTMSDLVELSNLSRASVRRLVAGQGSFKGLGPWAKVQMTAPSGQTQDAYFVERQSEAVQEWAARTLDLPGEVIPRLSPAAQELALTRSRLPALAAPDMQEQLRMRRANPKGGFLSSAQMQNPHVRQRFRRYNRVTSHPDYGRTGVTPSLCAAVGVPYSTARDAVRAYEERGPQAFVKVNPKEGRTCKAAYDYLYAAWLKNGFSVIGVLRNPVIQAAFQENGWMLPSERRAQQEIKKRRKPTHEALQKGGVRALDNLLPPIRRDYSDLEPFEILVIDQHRFNVWVIDDERGELFRPEGFFLQDLRTRLIYGAAVAKHYNSRLIGLAIRRGLKLWGVFKGLYSDNGKPELSNYVKGVMEEITALGLSVVEGAETKPGAHRKAIVKNAKAKMIEGTFRVLEDRLRDAGVPGIVKNLNDPQEYQEHRQKEIDRLAKAGKLLTFSEFKVFLFKELDRYSREKHHTGVHREWRKEWGRKPQVTTPFMCLRKCYEDGWRPDKLSDEAIDLALLAKARRKPNNGEVRLNGGVYRHGALAEFQGREVEVRYDSEDPSTVLIFNERSFVCEAEALVLGSMKDPELTRALIEKKRRERKEISLSFKGIFQAAPDLHEYSLLPAAERPAALVGKARKQKAKEAEERYRELTDEEFRAGLEERMNYVPPSPPRPIFRTAQDKYFWLLDQIGYDEELSAEDWGFIAEFENALRADARGYWETFKNSRGLTEKVANGLREAAGGKEPDEQM